MKKLAIMTVLAIAVGAASATDIGLRVGGVGGLNTDIAGFEGVGVTVGQKFGKLGAELAYAREWKAFTAVSRYSMVGSYDVASFKKLTFAAKAGVAYIDPAVGVSGYDATVGAGVSYPLTKKVSLVADYFHQFSQDRINSFNGNLLTLGAKYSF